MDSAEDALLHTNVERCASLKVLAACTKRLNSGLGEHLCIISIRVVRHEVDDILDVFGVCSELRRTEDGTLQNAAHQSGLDG